MTNIVVNVPVEIVVKLMSRGILLMFWLLSIVQNQLDVRQFEV